MKAVNEIFLGQFDSTGVLTGYEAEVLEPIANQCPYLGGPAVFQARVMLNYFYPEVDYADWCENIFPAEGERKENTDAVKELALSVYPNPTNGNCMIEYAGLPENSIFQITDVSGKVLIEKTFADESGVYNLSLENYAGGVYFYKVKGDCCNNLNGKIILVK